MSAFVSVWRLQRHLISPIMLKFTATIILAHISFFSLLLCLLVKYFSRFRVSFTKAFIIQTFIEVILIGLSILSFQAYFFIAEIFTLNSIVLFLVIYGLPYLLIGAPFYSYLIKDELRYSLGWPKGLVFSIILGTINLILEFIYELFYALTPLIPFLNNWKMLDNFMR